MVPLRVHIWAKYFFGLEQTSLLLHQVWETLWPVYLAMPQTKGVGDGMDLTVEQPNTSTQKGGCCHVTNAMMAVVSLLNFWASEPIS